MRSIVLSLTIAVAALSAARPAAAQTKCGEPFEVPVGTPAKAIAKIVVDQIFDSIVLTDAQQTRAVDIAESFITSTSKLDRKSADFAKQRLELQYKRDADLMKLVTSEGDKAKLAACFDKMKRPPSRRGSGNG